MKIGYPLLKLAAEVSLLFADPNREPVKTETSSMLNN